MQTFQLVDVGGDTGGDRNRINRVMKTRSNKIKTIYLNTGKAAKLWAMWAYGGIRKSLHADIAAEKFWNALERLAKWEKVNLITLINNPTSGWSTDTISSGKFDTYQVKEAIKHIMTNITHKFHYE